MTLPYSKQLRTPDASKGQVPYINSLMCGKCKNRPAIQQGGFLSIIQEGY